jgi:hypothetical protein
LWRSLQLPATVRRYLLYCLCFRSCRSQWHAQWIRSSSLSHGL